MNVRKAEELDNLSYSCLASARSALQKHPHCAGAPEKSIIIPVPKISCPQVNNDYRPVAPTSNVMKSLERFLLGVLQAEAEVAQSLDHLQFAYAK